MKNPKVASSKKKSVKKVSGDSLSACLHYLKHPDPDNPTPSSCYRQLDFPRDPITFKFKKGQPSYQYLAKLFPKKVKITDALTVHPSLRIWIPGKLKSQLQSKTHRFTITPIIFKGKTNYYALIQDQQREDWEIFIPPGNSPHPKSSQIEAKIAKLIKDKLKLPAYYFYQTIKYQPPTNTYHYLFWPSWLVYHKIKYPRAQREYVTNKALEKILRRSPEYLKFTRGFEQQLK